MNWKLDTTSLYIWNVEGAPFGVEKIDRGAYAPFRLWNKNRTYVTKAGKPLLFSSKREAIEYVEKAAKEYLCKVVEAVEA